MFAVTYCIMSLHGAVKRECTETKPKSKQGKKSDRYLDLKSQSLFVSVFFWAFTENLQLSGTGKLLEVVHKEKAMKGGEGEKNLTDTKKLGKILLDSNSSF